MFQSLLLELLWTVSVSLAKLQTLFVKDFDMKFKWKKNMKKKLKLIFSSTRTSQFATISLDDRWRLIKCKFFFTILLFKPLKTMEEIEAYNQERQLNKVIITCLCPRFIETSKTEHASKAVAINLHCHFARLSDNSHQVLFACSLFRTNWTIRGGTHKMWSEFAFFPMYIFTDDKLYFYDFRGKSLCEAESVWAGDYIL